MSAKVGIVSVGAHVPHYRLTGTLLGQVWGAPDGGGVPVADVPADPRGRGPRELLLEVPPGPERLIGRSSAGGTAPMIAGVDGCRGGWLVARAQRCLSGRLPELFVCDRFMDVLRETSTCAIVMVDMPIGLPDDAAPRSCDMEAQRMLGTRGRNSVFPAPPRSALTATTAVEFQALYRQARGKGAPVPLWGIVPKLREVDVAMSPGVQLRVKEVHPEVAWRRLAGSMLPSKKTDAGIAARTRLLSAFIGNVDELVHRPPRHARRDDVLDALVGLVVAADAATGQGRRTCAEEPPCNARGLRMETWY